MTIPAITLAFVLYGAALPLVLGAGAVVDGVHRVRARRPMMRTRLNVGLWLYLGAEVVGVLALFAVWLLAGVGRARRARLLDLTYRVQGVWVSFLFHMISRFLGLRFVVDGDRSVRPAPVIVFIQHASMLDVFVPTIFLTLRHGVRLRFVLKKELLASPCLDIAGHRLPNAFVDRASTESAAELARIRGLADGLGSDEGVLIYPEGTRFTPERRTRALAKLEASNPALASRASSLEHLLPPRLGGALALLEAAPELDVLIVSHHGLASFAKLEDLLSGVVLGKTIHIHAHRVPRAEIPATREGRIEWLYGVWGDVDRWLAEHERAA